jgi:hypothetical protein
MNQPQRHSLSGTVTNTDEPNWSQIGETLTLLALAVAQIDTSMKDGNDSVDTLTGSFTQIANNTSIQTPLQRSYKRLNKSIKT